MRGWFLPSRDELAMYRHLKATGVGDFRDGGGADNFTYWTSSQQAAEMASHIDFADGTSQIIAMNPDDPRQHAVLSDKGGLPLEWSADGSELLILRGNDLVVLKADGTQTRVTSFGARGPAGGRLVHA